MYYGLQVNWSCEAESQFWTRPGELVREFWGAGGDTHTHLSKY